MIDKTWDSWTDCIGKVYRPGDYVAAPNGYLGDSTQLVIGIVERINKVDSKNNPIVQRKVVNGKVDMVPSCTVSIRPLLFTREHSDRRLGRLVTVSQHVNVIKVDSPALRMLADAQNPEVVGTKLQKMVTELEE